MTNEEKANKILDSNYYVTIGEKNAAYNAALEIAQWKDEQYKIAYVVTRSEEHCDYVEKVFFDKEKAEEYCRSFNEDENSYHRDITKIEVIL